MLKQEYSPPSGGAGMPPAIFPGALHVGPMWGLQLMGCDCCCCCCCPLCCKPPCFQLQCPPGLSLLLVVAAQAAGTGSA